MSGEESQAVFTIFVFCAVLFFALGYFVGKDAGREDEAWREHLKRIGIVKDDEP